ncbi:5598_t:CDS:2 [Gigaspora margarita]|uniref:5598_t:CDS:1 n=1 Tax=Gigaspora margarita TaxID=4874 RepID=A0ABN7VH18_GIGMA|nr:5598_t:CDS:2 [Gigaspora margarita]
MGNNNCGKLGFGYAVEKIKYPRHVKSLADFNIVKISILERVTKSEDPNTTDKNVLAFAQDLDDVVIVKVFVVQILCSLCLIKNNNMKTWFVLEINKQLIFMNCGPTTYLKIANITIRKNYVLVLMTNGLHYTLVLLENGEVYSFSSTEYEQLDIGVSVGNRKSPVRINLNNYKLIATGDHHSIAVNDENKVYTWGFGKTYALENQRENDKLLPFKIKFE